jgi:hypothetical protein
VWTIQGELVSELRGHTDYVYEVCAGQNEAILSCGEDHSVVRGEAETTDALTRRRESGKRGAVSLLYCTHVKPSGRLLACQMETSCQPAPTAKSESGRLTRGASRAQRIEE